MLFICGEWVYFEKCAGRRKVFKFDSHRSTRCTSWFLFVTVEPQAEREREKKKKSWSSICKLVLDMFYFFLFCPIYFLLTRAFDTCVKEYMWPSCTPLLLAVALGRGAVMIQRLLVLVGCSWRWDVQWYRNWLSCTGKSKILKNRTIKYVGP